MTQTNDVAGMGTAPSDPSEPADAPEQEQNRDARMWAMICHLAGLGAFLPILPVLGGVICPLVVWLVKKDEFPFVDEQGKEAVNFQITMVIYAIATGLLCLVCIGLLLVPAVLIADVVCIILGAVKANDGYHFRYPPYLIIRFIK